VPDLELNGHYVRVQPGGSKCFLVIVRNRRGKQIWHTIGKTAHYTVAEAQDIVVAARDALLS